MPAPGATPIPGQDAMDLGGGLAATKYSDGSTVVWQINPPNAEVAYIEAGRGDPADLGDGRAAVVKPDGSVDVFDINNPPPQYQGAPGAPAGPGAVGQANAALKQPVVGTGVYPKGFGAPGAGTVAASTWNPASPGRNAGWGSIGAGTAGQQYGYGVPGFGQDPIKINELDLPYLFDPKVAPGYIPGSGTYNQYRLDSPTNQFGAQYGGLFATMQGPNGPEVVNTRFGLGGTGDPTNGSEVQTPQRYITGVATDSGVPQRGDAAWQAKYGGGGGGGFDPALAAAAPPYAAAAGGGGGGGYGGGGYGGGMGGGFFGSTVTSNWGQTAETAGKDYIATLFLRSDTPTGVGTPAFSAPAAMWQGLLDEIRAGRIYVTDPLAWQMIKEKTGHTPQSIGGAATGGQNVQGGAGTGSTTEDAIANKNAADAADRAAYWAYQQALLRQGDTRIALEEARDAWAKTYQEAQTTGTYNGAPTLAAKTQQDQTALGLMGLQAQLQGPRNWARYQSTFNATPQGFKDVIAAFQGRYQLPGTSGAQAQAQGGKASVAGLAGDILSGTYGNDTTQQPAALANPYQADLQNWAKMAPSQKEMILGNYENEGWYADDVLKLIKGAAPVNPGASSASYNFFQK